MTKFERIIDVLAIFSLITLFTPVSTVFASNQLKGDFTVEAVFTENILTMIGVVIVAAYIGSKLFNSFGVPQIVGFIVTGVALGPSLLNFIPLELSSELLFISEIALGLIGFDIGSHLKLD